MHKRKEEIKQDIQIKIDKIQSLTTEFEKRGIVMGKPLFNTQQQYEGEYNLDEEGLLHCPVMFLYEEHNQSDFVKDFREDHTFLDHLSYMFGEGVQVPWDKEQKYKLPNLELYVELGVATPLKPSTRVYTRRWLKIKQTTTLSKLLKHVDYVIPGFPVIYVVVNPSSFRTSFLKRKLD